MAGKFLACHADNVILYKLDVVLGRERLGNHAVHLLLAWIYTLRNLGLGHRLDGIHLLGSDAVIRHLSFQSSCSIDLMHIATRQTNDSPGNLQVELLLSRHDQIPENLLRLTRIHHGTVYDAAGRNRLIIDNLSVVTLDTGYGEGYFTGPQVNSRDHFFA